MKLFKLKLQMYGDPDPALEVVPTPEEPPKPNEEPTPPPTEVEPKFTQADMDAAIKKRLSKAPNKEEIKAYNDWKDAQKTEEEKRIEKDKQRDEELMTYKNQIQEYEYKAHLSANTVKPEYIDFVAFEIEKLVDDTNTFDMVLEQFKKDKPHYFGETVKPTPQSTGILHQGGPKIPATGWEQILRDKGKLK